jgi:hypothetical protein
VAQSGKKITSQAQAETELRKTFTEKTYASEPPRRPDYVPPTVYRGGSTHTVIFMNSGYGYYDPYGGWMPLMAHDYVVTPAHMSTVYHPRRYGRWIIFSFLGLMGGVFLVMLIMTFVRRDR